MSDDGARRAERRTAQHSRRRLTVRHAWGESSATRRCCLAFAGGARLVLER
jgi:hypothetical protein